MTLLPTAPSTNSEAARTAVRGSVVVAEEQTAGRGRLDRSWEAPVGAALTFSAVVAPELPDLHWPLIPLAAGLAVADAVRRSGVIPTLKWPNDVLVGRGKLAGILVERTGSPPVAVIGIGLNVDQSEAELPVPTATSLRLAGAEAAAADRTELFGRILAELTDRLRDLRTDPAGFVAKYRRACGTLGQEVEVQLPDGSRVRGTAETVDDEGRLAVRRGDGGTLVVSAGDVVHLRAADGDMI